MRGIWQDVPANRGNVKAVLVLGMFRLAQTLRGERSRPPLYALPYLVLYRLLVEWVLGVELAWGTKVGPGLRLYHGQGLVVHSATVIGRDVTLRQNTTIGARNRAGQPFSGCPVIGDGVDVGPGVTILGPVVVGDGAVIGAASVVLSDVPAGALVAGNPARPLRSESSGEPA